MNVLQMDRMRYADERGRVPAFQRWFRRAQAARIDPVRLFCKAMFALDKRRRLIDLSVDTQIGAGCYFGHASGITINPRAVIGCNANIHKGVTIGRENRGERKGAPTIGDNVWIGVGAVIVGSVRIGNDVLIAPNSFVNRDVPDHSVVIGNPCTIHRRPRATEGYINNTIDPSQAGLR